MKKEFEQSNPGICGFCENWVSKKGVCDGQEFYCQEQPNIVGECLNQHRTAFIPRKGVTEKQLKESLGLSTANMIIRNCINRFSGLVVN